LSDVCLPETAGREDCGGDPKPRRQGAPELIEKTAAVLGGDADLGERVTRSDLMSVRAICRHQYPLARLQIADLQRQPVGSGASATAAPSRAEPGPPADSAVGDEQGFVS
jgi:hypothetical protein